MLERVGAGISEFPANMKELLSTPRTLILFILGIALLLFVSTDPTMFIFFSTAIFSIGIIAYFVFLYHRGGYKLDLWRRLMVVGSCTIIISTTFYGYAYYYVNDIDLAKVPPGMLESTHWGRADFLDSSQQQLNGLLRVEVRGYMYNDLDPVRAPYPGAIWLATVKTVFIPSQDMIEEQVTKLIENLKQNGLSIDRSSKAQGHETVKSGHEAEYVEYEATLGMVGTGAFYSTAQGAKIHIRAEWWSCPDHGTAIIVVGAGQWGNTLSSSRIQNILVGRQTDDMDTVYNIQRLILETRCA